MSRTACVLVSLILVAPTRLALAQSGAITGVVVSGPGEVLTGVIVTTTPESGGLSRRTKTGSDGTYRFAGLPDGTYRVDFELDPFEVVRRNHVRVRHDSEARVDADLRARAICECITITPPSPWAQRVGQVVDKTGYPLPHARVELVGRQGTVTDGEGLFLIRVPVDETWPLTVSDTGFRSVTRQVSGPDAATLVVSLEYAAAAGAPDVERFRGCYCDMYLLRYGPR